MVLHRAATAFTVCALASSSAPGAVWSSPLVARPSACPIATHALEPVQMRQDLAELHFAISRAHAAPYRYTSKEALDARFDQVARRSTQRMTDLDFYRLLAPLIASLRNSHTSIQAPSDALRSMRMCQAVLPLVVRYRDGRPFVERNLSSDARIRPGFEITGVNGLSMTRVTRELLANRATEGLGDGAKFARLDQSLWLDLLIRYGPSDRYALRVRDPARDLEFDSVVAGAPAQAVAAAVPLFPSPEGAAQTISIDQASGIATMRIRSLLETDTPGFLSRSFHEIALSRVPNLVIDLRGNHGGIDWFNSELLSYVTDRPFRFYRERDYRARSYADLEHLTYGLDDFLLPEQVASLPPGVRERPFERWTLPQLMDFSLATDHAGGIQAPKTKDRFQGRVYMLVDGMSGSSAAELPSLAHHLGLATIVGEEPNGSYEGEVAGVIPILTLTNSRLQIRIPLMAYHNDVLPGVRPGRGPEPTFTVPETLEDSVRGVDTVMQFTRALIRARAPATTTAQERGADRDGPAMR